MQQVIHWCSSLMFPGIKKCWNKNDQNTETFGGKAFQGKKVAFTANLPPKIGRNCPPKERIVSQSSIFRVKMLGSGRVYVFCLFGNFSGFMCCFMLKSKFWSGFEIMPWRLQIFLKHWTIISDFFLEPVKKGRWCSMSSASRLGIFHPSLWKWRFSNRDLWPTKMWYPSWDIWNSDARMQDCHLQWVYLGWSKSESKQEWVIISPNIYIIWWPL